MHQYRKEDQRIQLDRNSQHKRRDYNKYHKNTLLNFDKIKDSAFYYIARNHPD